MCGNIVFVISNCTFSSRSVIHVCNLWCVHPVVMHLNGVMLVSGASEWQVICGVLLYTGFGCHCSSFHDDFLKFLLPLVVFYHRFASRTKMKVGRAFSFNKTPSKLKRAVSTMMSPFGSTTNLTPASQLAQMRLASCNNLNVSQALVLVPLFEVSWMHLSRLCS